MNPYQNIIFSSNKQNSQRVRVKRYTLLKLTIPAALFCFLLEALLISPSPQSHRLTNYKHFKGSSHVIGNLPTSHLCIDCICRRTGNSCCKKGSVTLSVVPNWNRQEC